MDRFGKLAVAAIAVLIVTVVGIILLPGSGGLGGHPRGTPSPTPSPTPNKSAPGSGDVDPPQGRLEPGSRYAVSRAGVALSFTVPTADWTSGPNGIHGHFGSPDETALTFFVAEEPPTPGVFADPCVHKDLRTFEPGLSGEAQAMASIGRTEVVSGPTDISIDGHPGRSLVVAVPDDPGCALDQFWLVYSAKCSDQMIVGCTSYPFWYGETIRTWLVDVDGRTLNITAEVRPDAAPVISAELQQIVDSIQFD